MKVYLIAGARPNFMKIAPLYRTAKKYKTIECKIVHTGQHYDYEMSQTFFEDLELPKPDYFLDAGSGSHAIQTGKIMVTFEELLQNDSPDWVILVGDVNSTLACSIVAKKTSVKVAHVEAGLRSRDMSMPEEINRIVTDSLSDLLFVTEQSGMDNLRAEGKPEEAIHYVGHVMIDNLFYQLEKLKKNHVKALSTHELKKKYVEYGFMTLHRPSNVDSEIVFKDIIEALNRIAEKIPLFFSIHPRTKKMMDSFNIQLSSNIICLKPLGFQEALYLWRDAKVVLTDSGGLQEETTALSVPCITIRENTERPITIEMGTNILAGTSKEEIIDSFEKAISGDKRNQIPPLWDGKASTRIWNVLMDKA